MHGSRFRVPVFSWRLSVLLVLPVAIFDAHIYCLRGNLRIAAAVRSDDNQTADAYGPTQEFVCEAVVHQHGRYESTLHSPARRSLSRNCSGRFKRGTLKPFVTRRIFELAFRRALSIAKTLESIVWQLNLPLNCTVLIATYQAASMVSQSTGAATMKQRMQW